KCFLIIICLLLFFAACGRGGGAARDSGVVLAPALPNPLESRGQHTIELVMFSDIERDGISFENQNAIYSTTPQIYAHPYLVSIAEKFTAEYPNINVNIVVISDADNYAATLKDMMALDGYAPDLLLAPRGDEFLIDAEVQKHLIDIYEIIDADPHFDHDKYFMDAIRAFSTRDGQLYEFPLNFKPSFVAVNKNINESLVNEYDLQRQIDFASLVELHAKHDASGIGLYRMNYFDPIFCSYDYFYNSDNGWFGFTDPKYLHLMEISALFSYNAEIVQSVTVTNFISGNEKTNAANQTEDREAAEIYMFQKHPFSAIQYMLPYNAGSGPSFSNAKPLTDESGRLLLEKQDHPLRFSISSGSTNKELAWEFIKYAAAYSHEDFITRRNTGSTENRFYYPMYSFRHYVPVYKPSLKTVLEYTLTGTRETGILSYGQNIRVPSDERLEWITDHMLDALNRGAVYNPDIWQVREATKIIYLFLFSLDRLAYNVTKEEYIEIAQEVYEKLALADPEMKWIDEQLMQLESDDPHGLMQILMRQPENERKKFIFSFEFNKKMNEAAPDEIISGAFGEIEEVWAMLTDHSFEYYDFYFDDNRDRKMLRTWYTDETESLTNDQWESFQERGGISQELQKKLRAIDNPLELYIFFNREVKPLIKIFLGS
ncbi:MAG: ABC transporter substrate-binding protein, partial [Defluviitaleaceae bacterium]|nr:ABC transporter substrate-binding protein [Defluviitaleaceae bacterium]